MDFLKPETLDLFLIYVVPGFVAMKFHDLMLPPRGRDFSSALIEIVSYSMLNLAVLFWLVQLVQRPGYRAEHPVCYAVVMLFVVAVAPVVWAFLSRTIRESQWFQKFSPHPIPTAWDYFFRQRKGGWVLFHLKSGELLGGLFSQGSFASSLPESSDIYVEEVWRVDAAGKFQEKISQTGGALVRLDECTHLEFFELSGG